ncbi:MAG: hypothetical protein IPN67_05330 [Bacteroidales bacterium]|nr:hypothetical protein [Bacteroidales bacterium]
MYESKKQQVLTRVQFILRMINHLLAVIVLLILSLTFGMAGYVIFEHLSWTDAFFNASMLLGLIPASILI